MTFENASVRKRMITLEVGIKEVAEASGFSYSSVAHWLQAPMTKKNLERITNGLDRIEAERKNNGRN